MKGKLKKKENKIKERKVQVKRKIDSATKGVFRAHDPIIQSWFSLHLINIFFYTCCMPKWNLFIWGLTAKATILIFENRFFHDFPMSLLNVILFFIENISNSTSKSNLLCFKVVVIVCFIYLFCPSFSSLSFNNFLSFMIAFKHLL